MNLRDYIRGQRQGKEANQLERKAMDDPFLQDAIDGYDSVEGDHISTIENLEKRLSSTKKFINKQIWLWVAAAAIILLIGTPLLLKKPYIEDDIPLASSDIVPQKKETETPLLKEDTVLLADHHALNKKDVTEPKVKQTISPSLSVPTSRETIEAAINKDSEVTEIVEEIKNDSDKDIPVSTVQPTPERTFLGEPPKEITGILTRRAAGEITSQQAQRKNTWGKTPSVTQPDKIIVSGRIVDETGEPLRGATICLSDTRTGTISDTTGNFQLIVPKEGQGALLASYIGMKNTPIPLKENVGDIMMKADDMALSEVTIVAYGTQKKELLTGSVSTVEGKTIFGEDEFKKYFTKNYDKDICAGQNITIMVEFFVDPIGRPSQINIKENSCPVLESEIKRLLLGSPLWSKINRKVILQIELP